MMCNTVIQAFDLSKSEDIEKAIKVTTQFIPMVDLSFDPLYQTAVANSFNWDVYMLYFNHEDFHAIKFLRLQPFILNEEICGYDMASTYGHGGWHYNSAPSAAAIEKLQTHEKFFQQNNVIVSEYSELIKIGSEPLELLTNLENLEVKKTVLTIKLDQPVGLLWASVRDNQRKVIISALKKGVRIDHSPATPEKVMAFEDAYIKFVDKKGMNKFWKFSQGFFLNFFKTLGSNRVSVINAIWQDNIIASFFVIFGYDSVYYFFSVSNQQFNHLNGNSLIMWNLIMNSKIRGYKLLYLGGGKTSDSNDDLFKFKNSFGAQELQCFVIKKVLDHEKFNQACLASKSKQVSASLFPPYANL